jgi:hypothetical protein
MNQAFMSASAAALRLVRNSLFLIGLIVVSLAALLTHAVAEMPAPLAPATAAKPPIIKPAAGTYAAPLTVTITDQTKNATIYYSVNGGAGTEYTHAITVEETETITAYATASGDTKSSTTSAIYTIEPVVPEPAFMPKGGKYGAEQYVALEDTTTIKVVTIHYTLDGSDPLTSSTAKKYAGTKIAIAKTATIKAAATAPGCIDSPVRSETYTIVGPPSVTTDPATAINASSATLNAAANDEDGTASVWFRYGTSSTALTLSTPQERLKAETSAQSFSAQLTGLKNNTTYYFQPVVSTVGGTAKGEVMSFTTHTPPLSIATTALPNARTNTAYSESLQANGGTPPYTWTVATGSTLPGWLTLSGSTLSGTPTAAATIKFSLTVTDSSVPPQSKTRALSLTVVSATACGTGNESVMKGQFAFILRGATADGTAEAVGSFTADGKGNIAAGHVDANGGEIDGNGWDVKSGSVTPKGSFYSVGSDNRGCATIVTPFYTFVTRFAISPDPAGKVQGAMIEFEPAPVTYVATGQIFQQEVPAAVPTGNWVHTEWGEIEAADYSSGLAVTGVDVYSSGGEITNGEYDYQTYGGVTSQTGVTGKYTNPDPATGRYTLTNTGGYGVESPNSLSRAAYLVSGTKVLEISSTEYMVLAGEMQLQSGALTLSGNLAMYGSAAGAALAGFGLMNANGTSYTAHIYQNSGGTWETPTPVPTTCSYTIDSLGRVPTSGANCGSNYGFPPGSTTLAWTTPPVIYLTGPNTGFLYGGAGMWMVQPQSATSIAEGNYYFGMQLPWYSGSFDDGSSGVATITGGDTLTGIEDTINNLQANVTISATFTVNSNGTFSSSSDPGVLVGLVVSDSQFVEVVEDNTYVPSLLVFDTIP